MSEMKMRMLKWMSEVTRENMIRKRKLNGNIGVVLIMEKNSLKLVEMVWACYEKGEIKTIKVVIKTNIERSKRIRRSTKR